MRVRRFVPFVGFVSVIACSGGGDAPGADGPDTANDATSEVAGDALADSLDDAIRDTPADTHDVGDDAGSARTPLSFGVVEEQHAVCFKGDGYPCARLDDDTTRRKALAAAAPGMIVRLGGYETERTGLGFVGNAARRGFEGVGSGSAFGDQLDPAWLIGRAKLAAYRSFILAVPVTRSDPRAYGGTAHEWSDVDVRASLDAWKTALDASGFPPPAFIELGNEPWNYPASNGSDGYKGDPAGYVKKARLVGAAVRAKIVELGWPTRIAVVVDNWPGGRFESGGTDM